MVLMKEFLAQWHRTCAVRECVLPSVLPRARPLTAVIGLVSESGEASGFANDF